VIAFAAAGLAALVAMRTGTERLLPADAAANLLAGWSFAAAGLVALRRRPGSRPGQLMVAASAAWFVADLRFVEAALPFTTGMVVQGFYWLVLAVLLATFPTGRAETRLERVTVVAIAVFAIPNAIGTLPFDPPRECPVCPRNLLSLTTDPELSDAASAIIGAVSVVVALLAVACLLARWRRATPSGRRTFTPVFAGGLVLFAIVAPGLASGSPLEDALPEWTKTLALLALATGILVGLARSWLDRAAIGRLLIELGGTTTPDGLRAALAAALHDPSVELHLDGAAAPKRPGRALTRLRGVGTLEQVRRALASATPGRAA
jgi:hypothetical protein